VRQVTVSLGATWQVVRDPAARWRELSRHPPAGTWSNISVVAGQGSRQESGSRGLWRPREGYARFIETEGVGAKPPMARSAKALVNLESVPAPAGEMDVVLGAGWPGVMLHEAVRPRARGRFQPQEVPQLLPA